MIQSLQKNSIKILFIVLGWLVFVFFGCKLVKSNMAPRKQLVTEEVAADMIYQFLESGIKNKYMSYIDRLRIDKVFYTKNRSANQFLFCTSYQLFFINNNHPTWELCLPMEEGKLLLDYDTKNYVNILTEAAFLYKSIDSNNQQRLLSISKIEENVNKKLAELKSKDPDKNEENKTEDNTSKLPNIPVV